MKKEDLGLFCLGCLLVILIGTLVIKISVTKTFTLLPFVGWVFLIISLTVFVSLLVIIYKCD